MDNMQKPNNTYHIELSSFGETVIDEYEVCQLTVSKNGERLERLSVWGEDPSNGELEPYTIFVKEEDYTLSDFIEVTPEVTKAIEDYMKDGNEFKVSIKEGINTAVLDEIKWSNHQEVDTKKHYEHVEDQQIVPSQIQEDTKYYDAEIVYVSTPGIYSDSQKEEVYQVENIKSTEVNTNDTGATIQVEKTIPHVDQRYLGTEKDGFNDKKEEDKKREEARIRYVMQQMNGRDY